MWKIPHVKPTTPTASHHYSTGDMPAIAIRWSLHRFQIAIVYCVTRNHGDVWLPTPHLNFDTWTVVVLIFELLFQLLFPKNMKSSVCVYALIMNMKTIQKVYSGHIKWPIHWPQLHLLYVWGDIMTLLGNVRFFSRRSSFTNAFVIG